AAVADPDRLLDPADARAREAEQDLRAGGLKVMCEKLTRLAHPGNATKPILDRRPPARPSRDARLSRPAHAAGDRARVRPDADRNGRDRGSRAPLPRDD